MKSTLLITALLSLALVAPRAFAADDSSTDNSTQTASTAKKKKKQADASATAAADEEAQNNRAKALEGSKSKFSGQFQLAYAGSSLDHPLSKFAPNPGNTIPAPVVSLSGTVSARYRLDPKTTVGIGSGITTQHPFQGPSGTTIANPYADIAHSFKLGPIANYLDFSAGIYTDKQNHTDQGYMGTASISDEVHYDWSFGLTTGVVIGADGNTFQSGTQYDPSQQTSYDFFASPYVEFALSKTFNLRSVSNIYRNHTRDLNSGVYQRPKVDQTLGLGSSISEAVFLYTYVRMVPYPYSNVRSDNTTFGMSTIINLF